MKKPDTGLVLTALCMVLVIAVSVLLGMALQQRLALTDSRNAVTELSDTVKKNFYFYDEAKDAEAMTTGALLGMIVSLDDPYANYYTAEQYDAHLKEDAGDYVGIGISVAPPDETGSTILDVYTGSPAEKAGIRRGDVILSVNGSPVANMEMDPYLKLFFAKDDVPDVLVLLRGGNRITVSLVASEIHVNRVNYELLANGVGYVRITEFSGSVVSDFWNAVTDLRGKGAERFVLDLRNNPGGGLTEVLGVANYLIPTGQVIVTIKSKTESENVYKSEGTQKLEGKLAVLVNGETASASELLSGALQDYGLGEIIGTQTFGKGIVQSYYRLRTTGGWVKLTTDAYYTPNDVCIHKVGVTPDQTVTLPADLQDTPTELIPRAEDTQLNAALSFLTEDGERQLAAAG